MPAQAGDGSKACGDAVGATSVTWMALAPVRAVFHAARRRAVWILASGLDMSALRRDLGHDAVLRSLSKVR
eukprot:7641748-Lingulodinium_polyedra.AAC.1